MDRSFDHHASPERGFFTPEAPGLAPTSPPMTGRPIGLEEPRQPQLGEPSCDDVPAAVGLLIAAAYIGILIAFGLVFSGSSDVLFMLGVCAVYLAVYLGVPTLFLKMEQRGRAGSTRGWGDFLRSGLATATGRTEAGAALAQILTIPVSLVAAVFGIGLMMKLAG